MRTTARIALIVLAGLTLVLPARAVVQEAAGEASMPPGPGKDLIVRACTGCHTLELTTGWRAPREEWARIVAQMITVGTKISREEAALIVDYLAEHYAPLAAAGEKASEQAAGPATAPPADPARDVLTSKCFQCHGRSMWQDLRLDRRGWEGVVYRMVGRGALWTQTEIDTMADYLARTQAPAAQPVP